MNVDSEAGFGSLSIDEGVNRLIYNEQYQHGGRTLIPYYLQRNVSTDTY